jgi:serine acetyltransferase
MSAAERTLVQSEPREPGLFECLSADFAQYCELKRDRNPRSLTAYLDTLLQPGMWAVAIFRFSQVFYRIKLRPFSRLLCVMNLVLFGAEYWPGSVVGPGLVTPHPVGTGFAVRRMGRNVTLYAMTHIGGGGYDVGDGIPTIGDEVKVFDSAKIFGPVTIGDGAWIGAGCTIFKDIPAGAVVMTAPSKIVRFRNRSGDAGSA